MKVSLALLQSFFGATPANERKEPVNREEPGHYSRAALIQECCMFKSPKLTDFLIKMKSTTLSCPWPKFLYLPVGIDFPYSINGAV